MPPEEIRSFDGTLSTELSKILRAALLDYSVNKEIFEQ